MSSDRLESALRKVNKKLRRFDTVLFINRPGGRVKLDRYKGQGCHGHPLYKNIRDTATDDEMLIEIDGIIESIENLNGLI